MEDEDEVNRDPETPSNTLVSSGGPIAASETSTRHVLSLHRILYNEDHDRCSGLSIFRECKTSFEHHVTSAAYFTIRSQSRNRIASWQVECLHVVDQEAKTARQEQGEFKTSISEVEI